MKDPRKEFSFTNDDFPTLAQPTISSESSSGLTEKRSSLKEASEEEVKPPDLAFGKTLLNGAYDKNSKLSTTSKSFAPKQKPNEEADRKRFGIESYMEHISDPKYESELNISMDLNTLGLSFSNDSQKSALSGEQSMGGPDMPSRD